MRRANEDRAYEAGLDRATHDRVTRDQPLSVEPSSRCPPPSHEASEHGLPPRLLEHPVFVMMQVLRMARQRGQGAGLAARDSLRAHGQVRLPHLGVLGVLAHFGPSSQREVADRLHFDASDLVGIVDTLESDGYVSRLRDPGDRRRYLLTITTAGRSALDRTERLSLAARQRFLEPLSEAERATLLDLLHRLYVHHDSEYKRERRRSPDQRPARGGS